MSTRAPGVLSCLLLLAAMDGAARALGLRRTFALLRRMAPERAGSAAADRLVSDTVQRVAVAAAFYPRRALCLEQSLALFVLLRRRGVAAELRLGVQPRPFYAHAWVEVDGRPVSESADLPLTIVPFPSLGV
ncbi:MAG TPA: lasso peptide biosynthesis B2 protein [Longimicrobiales bacterium]